MNIKKVLLKIPAVYKLVRASYVWCLQRRIAAPLLGKKEVFFVQVGSNDGVQGDPIHRLIVANPHWRGMFIEPVAFLFERLKTNYNNEERFIFENVAVGTVESLSTFYYVSEKAKEDLGEELPYWHDQIGSFDRGFILKLLGKDYGARIEPYIVEQEVKCYPLESILDRNQVTAIDLLHIDTEGYDYKVLSQFNFKKHRPAVILYEHFVLSPDEFEKARALLRAEGYRLHQYEQDTLAILEK